MPHSDLTYISRDAVAKALFLFIHPRKGDWFDGKWPLLCKANSERKGPFQEIETIFHSYTLKDLPKPRGDRTRPLDAAFAKPATREPSQEDLFSTVIDIFDLLITQNANALDSILDALEERFSSRDQTEENVKRTLKTLKEWSEKHSPMISFNEAGQPNLTEVTLQSVSQVRNMCLEDPEIDILVINHEVYARLNGKMQLVESFRDIHAAILTVFLWRGPIPIDADDLYFAVVPSEKQKLKPGYALSQFSTYLSRPVNEVHKLLNGIEGFGFPPEKPKRNPYVASITCLYRVFLTPARQLQLLG